MILSVVERVEASIVTVAPETVKLPVITALPPTLKLFVTVAECNVARPPVLKVSVTVKSSPIVTSSGKETVIILFVPTELTTVFISFAVPSTLSVSVKRSTDSAPPVSPSKLNVDETAAVVAPVILPWASIVNTGTAVAEP